MTVAQLASATVQADKSAAPQGLFALLQGAFGSSFAQNVTILLLTALVTGLAVPRVKARMDMSYFAKQKDHEARLARQASLIEEQTKFLKEFVDVLWQLHYAMIQVTYARADVPSRLSESDFRAIWKEYGAASWQALQQYRRVISSAIYLVPPSHYERLLEFHRHLLSEDARLTSYVERMAERKIDWYDVHNRYLIDEAKRLDEEIAALAGVLRLRAPEPVPSEGTV